MNPRPVAVRPLTNYELEIKFSNDEVRVYDLKPILDLGVFKELKDVQYFNQARFDGNTVVWPNEQDICPDTLYIDSVLVSK